MYLSFRPNYSKLIYQREVMQPCPVSNGPTSVFKAARNQSKGVTAEPPKFDHDVFLSGMASHCAQFPRKPSAGNAAFLPCMETLRVTTWPTVLRREIVDPAQWS